MCEVFVQAVRSGKNVKSEGICSSNEHDYLHCSFPLLDCEIGVVIESGNIDPPEQSEISLPNGKTGADFSIDYQIHLDGI